MSLIINPYAFTGVSYDADAQAYFDALVTAGSSMTTANKNAWNDCVVGLKADAVWAIVSELYVFVGPADLTGALVKAKGSGSMTNVNFVSGDYSRTAGLTSNGSTKYLNTGYNASNLSNTSHTLYWNATGMETSGDKIAIGAYTDTVELSILSLDCYANYTTARCFRSGTFTEGNFPKSNSGLVSSGSIAGVRRSNNDAELYQDGVSKAPSSTSITPSLPARPFYLFALNISNSPTTITASTARVAMIGAAMSDGEMAAFDARIATYIASVT